MLVRMSEILEKMGMLLPKDKGTDTLAPADTWEKLPPNGDSIILIVDVDVFWGPLEINKGQIIKVTANTRNEIRRGTKSCLYKGGGAMRLYPSDSIELWYGEKSIELICFGLQYTGAQNMRVVPLSQFA